MKNFYLSLKDSTKCYLFGLISGLLGLIYISPDTFNSPSTMKLMALLNVIFAVFKILSIILLVVGAYKSYREFKKEKSKIYGFGLMNIADEFAKYITLEPELFNENRVKYPNMPDEENWTLVYKRIDVMISEEITRAKECVKKARGCAVTLIILIFVPVSLAIAISSIFFV